MGEHCFGEERKVDDYEGEVRGLLVIKVRLFFVNHSIILRGGSEGVRGGEG